VAVMKRHAAQSKGMVAEAGGAVTVAREDNDKAIPG